MRLFKKSAITIYEIYEDFQEDVLAVTLIVIQSGWDIIIKWRGGNIFKEPFVSMRTHSFEQGMQKA